MSAGKPIIGITTYLMPAAWARGSWRRRSYRLRTCARSSRPGAWRYSFRRRRLPIPRRSLSVVDGLVFSGGSDLDPELYDAELHPETAGIVRERDEAELVLMRAALDAGPAAARDLPGLAGVERGARRRPRCSTSRIESGTVASRDAGRVLGARGVDLVRESARVDPRRAARREVVASPGVRPGRRRACASRRTHGTAPSRASKTRRAASPSASSGIPRRATTSRSSRASSRRRARTSQAWIMTGVPGSTDRANHSTAPLSRRMHPCERAVPSGSARLAPPRPWIATRPGPPP